MRDDEHFIIGKSSSAFLFQSEPKVLHLQVSKTNQQIQSLFFFFQIGICYQFSIKSRFIALSLNSPGNSTQIWHDCCSKLLQGFQAKLIVKLEGGVYELKTNLR